jgi:nucleoid-associated protein YgaU
MARETKVGLLVGMGIILLIGIIVSDHLSVVHHQTVAQMEDFGNVAQNSVDGQANFNPDAPDAPDKIARGDTPLGEPVPANRVVPVPLPNETINALDHRQPGAAPQPPAPRLADAPKPAPPQQLAMHVVKHGDTAYQLARHFYKNGEMWTLIQKANPATVGPKGQLKDGTTLVIPKPAIPEELAQTGLLEPVDAANASGIDGEPVRLIAVRKNQTLRSIARERLGDAGRVKELLQLNADQLQKESDLRPGMLLRLPVAKAETGGGQPGVATPTLKAPAADESIQTAPRTYTVKRGDTLARIAARELGSAAMTDSLFKLNRKTLDSKDELKIGQVLILPDLPNR